MIIERKGEREEEKKEERWKGRQAMGFIGHHQENHYIYYCSSREKT